jgi:outer membrane protein assembly factor BamB
MITQPLEECAMVQIRQKLPQSPSAHPIPIVVRWLHLFLTAAIIPSVALSGDWPTVGGNSMRHGQSDQFGPSGPDILWEGSHSAWFGGQVYIEGDRMVTMRFQGIDVAPIVCYDITNGEELWSVDFPGVNSRSVPRGFRGGQVYATNFQETGQDTLYALDPGDGSILWTSEVFCERGIIWSAAFAPNGDLFVAGTGSDIARINHADGTEVYQIERTIPNTGAETLCVYGNTLYGFEGSIVTPKVLTAWDLDTGQRKYSSPTLPGDGDQEIPFTIGPDGTIYVLRDGGGLHALIDTGVSIIEHWSVPISTSPAPTYSQIGIGWDGTVYVPDGQVLVRLDPATGAEINHSPPLVSTSTLNARFAIGADGTIYASNGGFDDGALFALSAKLDILWSDPILSIVYAGPALGENGLLAVAGRGTILKVYQPDPASIDGEQLTVHQGQSLHCHPNPFRHRTEIAFELSETIDVNVMVFDVMGRRVRSLVYERSLSRGRHSIPWLGRNDSGDMVDLGVYFVHLKTGDDISVTKALMIR